MVLVCVHKNCKYIVSQRFLGNLVESWTDSKKCTSDTGNKSLSKTDQVQENRRKRLSDDRGGGRFEFEYRNVQTEESKQFFVEFNSPCLKMPQYKTRSHSAH